MKDLDVVKSLQPTHDLNENLPYHILWDILLFFLMPRDLLEEITVVRVLHDNTVKGKTY